MECIPSIPPPRAALGLFEEKDNEFYSYFIKIIGNGLTKRMSDFFIRGQTRFGPLHFDSYESADAVNNK